MKRRFLAFLALGAAATAALLAVPAVSQVAPSAPQAAAGPQSRTIDSVIALVNGELISAWDVRNRMTMMLMAYGAQQQPSKEVMAQVQHEAIESLIDEKIKLQEFNKLSKKQKIGQDEIDEEISGLARQNRMTSDQFVKNFESSGASIKTLRDQIESQIAWRALIGGRYGKTVRVSELRITEMLDRIKDSLDKPQYRLAEIFLYAPDNASLSNAKTRAGQIVDRLNQGGADFKAVARQFSASPTASQGGDMGWLTLGDMRPEIEKAVLKAPAPPVVLQPIESEGGIYIIALTGKRDPSQAPPATLDLVQVAANSSDAAAKLQLVKGKAKVCNEVEAAAKEVGGVTSTPMNDISLGQIAGAYRGALEPLEAGQSTDILSLDGDARMMFYVCAKRAGAGEMPSREDVRDTLFDGEITMISERYLRDLKREATIERK